MVFYREMLWPVIAYLYAYTIGFSVMDKSVFTKYTSTFNGFLCIITVWHENIFNYRNFHAVGSHELIQTLYRFAAYLFVDGLFMLLNQKKINKETVTFLLHHAVGGLGIFLMAYLRIGLGLGLYFAATEFSTLFLNLWKIRKSAVYFKIFALTFFLSRIVTLPLLWVYIYENNGLISMEHWSLQLMAYGGCGTLSLLNVIWFIGILLKLRSN